MNQAIVNGKTDDVPSRWNELSKKQLKHIARVQFSGYPALKAQVLFLKILLWKNNAFFRKMSDTAIADLLLLTDFLFEKDGDKTIFATPKITKQLIPSVRIGFRKYYGPGDKLKNVSVMEWARAEKYFLHFHKKRSMEDLNNLVAVLYRPLDSHKKTTDADYNGDLRLRYNDFTHAANVKKIQRLDAPTKYAIFMYYFACRESIYNAKKYTNVFDGQESKTIKSNPDYAWIDFIMDLSGKEFTDEAIEKAGASFLHTVLYKLNRILQFQAK